MSGLVGSVAVPTSLPLRLAVQQPEELVFAILGDSITYGGGPSLDYAMGWRLPFQRLLAEEGIQFRMVGRGFGALNAAGATNGRNPNVADFHDTPIFTPKDVRYNAYSGYRITQTVAITAVNTGTGFITAPGHGLVSGETWVPASTGSPIVFSTVQPVYWVTNVGGGGANTFQVSAYDGGTTALTIVDAGSGSLSMYLGLMEMLPAIAETWDVAPTDVIVNGGTNDIIQAINTGVSVAATLALLQAAEIAYEAAVNAAAPTARKYRGAIPSFHAAAANHAACTEVAVAFNAWFRDVRLPQLGRLWSFVDVASPLSAPVILDGVHPTRSGYELMANEYARAVVQAVGTGHASDRVPREIVKRPAQASVELGATNHRITIPTQASLAPGANSFFCAISYMPFSLPTGLNVILQQENPYQDGCVIGHNTSRLSVYWKSTGTCIPPTAYTTIMQMYRWHRIFAFFDAVRQEAVLCCNGRYIQRVYTTAAAITSQDGWTMGAFSGLSSALGLYQDFVMGHGASLSIENAVRLAEADYYQGEIPVGVTARYYLNEGTGTSVAGAISGATAGTITSGTWVASGLYLAPWNHKYAPPKYSQRTATTTTTYTAVPGELVPYDTTAAGFTLTVPGGVAMGAEFVSLAEVGGSTNTLTVVPATGTINGGANITVSTAGARTRIMARGANLITVA